MLKKAPSGTQSVLRTVEILKAVAERKEIGWRLTDLSRHCGLDKSTTYRIAACLTSQGLLQQRPGDRRYIPGPVLFELALALPSYSAFRESCRRELEQLSTLADGIAFLYMRSGEETICIDRVVATEVQSITGVGTRRLLIESTFGIAMLLAMPSAEQRALIKANQTSPHKSTGARALAHQRILNRSRRAGFGYNRDDIVPGVTGIAVPILDRSGQPVASIGVMCRSARLDSAKTQELVKFLRKCAEGIGRTKTEIIETVHTPAPAKKNPPA